MFYPPDPTERSAYIGGNVVTNASGARSFKFGATRKWIHGLRVVLPNGDVIETSRDELVLGKNPFIELSNSMKIPRPNYPLPKSSKNVAGPVLTDASHPLDLFVGTDGIFGVISEVHLRVIRQPATIVSIFAFVNNVRQAIQVARFAQNRRKRGEDPIPMSLEYLDERAVKIMRSKDSSISEKTKGILIIEQDAESEDQLFDFLEIWMQDFESCEIENTSVAQNHNEIEHHKLLRHAVPERINEIARTNGQPKLGTDYSAPISLMEELFDFAETLGKQYEGSMNIPSENFGYAIWSHFGDNHIHLNFLPTNNAEKEKAKAFMVEFMHKITEWEGSIAAEHGLGKKKFAGVPALELQLGFEGLKQVYDMKMAIDPEFLLNPGNLLGNDLTRYE